MESNSQIKHSMNPRIPQVVPHLQQQHLHILLGPAQDTSEDSQAHSLQTLVQLRPVEATDLFQTSVFRPRAEGQDVLDDLDIGEAGLSYPGFDAGAGTEGAAGDRLCFVRVVKPSAHGVVFCQRAVLRVVVDVEVLKLDPSAWTEASDITLVSTHTSTLLRGVMSGTNL